MAKKKFDYNEMGESKLPVARAREMLKLKRATINDFDVIKNRSYEYLTYCDENNRVPTLRGLCVCLGVHQTLLTDGLLRDLIMKQRFFSHRCLI